MQFLFSFLYRTHNPVSKRQREKTVRRRKTQQTDQQIPTLSLNGSES
jgi:hypothetical protein